MCCLSVTSSFPTGSGTICGQKTRKVAVLKIYAFKILIAHAIQLQLVNYFCKHFLFPKKIMLPSRQYKKLFSENAKQELWRGHTMIAITLCCPELILDDFWLIVKLSTENQLCNILQRYSTCKIEQDPH
jgi:hypothetical protein